MDTDLNSMTLDLIEQVARLRLNEVGCDVNNREVCIKNHSPTSVHTIPFSRLEPDLQMATNTPAVCIADNWITCHFDPHTSTAENIEAFTSRWRPSCTQLSDAEWIAVNRGMSHSPKPPLIHEMKASFETLAETHRKDGNITLTAFALEKLAREHNITSAKWLIFADSVTVDAAWNSIVRLICLERGKGFAKVSVNKNVGHHVICVYVDDFSDTEEVMELRNDLRRIGVTQKIGFKLDAYSHMGIYSRNAWGISPNRYYE